ncbi:hypothetical protein E2P64_09480 [Candidatus Bathyarchaeota archaeon]|nr:hypothetical protein E2P64_09480 [Candidatus Bathyarchaeota archaeon]
MTAEVAVATVQGKAYFLIVKKLKEREIPFLSLVPGEAVPADIKVVITTEHEKHLMNHEKVLVYDGDTAPDVVANEIRKILQGKEAYERIIIGVDPGEVIGLVVIADGKVNETVNCFSAHEALVKVKDLIGEVDFTATTVTIKVGNGVPTYKELIDEFDRDLPMEVTLKVVSEAGTNRPLNHNKHRRGLRDIASAMRIAGRAGHVYPRRRLDERD